MFCVLSCCVYLYMLLPSGYPAALTKQTACVISLVSQLTVQEATTKIDLRQCITDEVVPLSLGSSTEANTIELTTAWDTHGGGKKDYYTNRFDSANFCE